MTISYAATWYVLTGMPRLLVGQPEVKLVFSWICRELVKKLVHGNIEKGVGPKVMELTMPARLGRLSPGLFGLESRGHLSSTGSHSNPKSQLSRLPGLI